MKSESEMILKKKFTASVSNVVLAVANRTVGTTTKLSAALLVGIAFFICAAKTAQAATFTVTKTANTFDNVCDADCSLREAINRAGSTPANDVIVFDSSVFNVPQTIFGSIGFFSGGGSLTIQGTGANMLTISANNSGRVLFVEGAVLTLNDLTITGGNLMNAALIGGGIAVLGASSQVTINNSIITGNSADGGGGIAHSGGVLNINNSTISGNTAKGNGGGIYSTSSVNINNSTISGNSTLTGSGGSGGGIYNAPPSTASTFTITNSTISFNLATGLGGGGVYNQSTTLSSRNSIFSNNNAASGRDVSGPLTSQGYNLIQNSAGVFISGTTTGNILGQDPLLSPLTNNGGSTLTHALNPGSPAIDAADPNSFPPVDQRGFARPADGDGNATRLPDIGAFERNAIFPHQQFSDFDGDDRADVSVFRPSNGVWYLNQSTGGLIGVAFGANGDVITPADYDGDGKTDIAVFRPSNGVWYLLKSQTGFAGINFGAGGDVPVPADYDGDGKADLAVFRPGTGTWFTSTDPATNYGAVQFGAPGDKPVPADYDGDGKTDLAIFRPSTGVWYIQRSRLGLIGITFGAPDDQLVPADYDGDGKTDVAVFRPSTGTWFTSTNPQTNYGAVVFGANGDLPVPADYDGDGRADIAVFRPSNGVWYINRSTQGFTGVLFGVGEDKPIPNAYVR